MKKKVISMLLTACLCLGLTACGGGSDTQQSAGTEGGSTEASSTQAGSEGTEEGESGGLISVGIYRGKRLRCPVCLQQEER